MHNDGSEQERALAAFGLQPDRPLGDDDVEVWPCNAAIVQVFQDMDSSWVHGMAGPTGLRHEELSFWLDLNEVSRADWRDVAYGVRLMEKETLLVWAKRSSA